MRSNFVILWEHPKNKSVVYAMWMIESKCEKFLIITTLDIKHVCHSQYPTYAYEKIISLSSKNRGISQITIFMLKRQREFTGKLFDHQSTMNTRKLLSSVWYKCRRALDIWSYGLWFNSRFTTRNYNLLVGSSSDEWLAVFKYRILMFRYHTF